jgi:RNA polymerase sigma factor (sigma-70 family)
MTESARMLDLGPRAELLFAFCRMQLPAVALSSAICRRHLERTYQLFRSKTDAQMTWEAYLDHLYPIDWFLASACLENNSPAWEALFAARAGRSDCLLLDALRARAVRLYPRDEERQDSAVGEFWSQLVAPEAPGRLPILGRYDGQRPLVPWLIRVFQNWHISQLRRHTSTQALPEDDLASPPPPAGNGDIRWREAFVQAAHEWLEALDETGLILLGLRLRYRLSQREVANLLKVHEGTVSRRTDQVRDACLEYLQERLAKEGWTGDDLSDLIRTEMHALLLDDPRLSVDHLAKLLAKQGKKLPA